MAKENVVYPYNRIYLMINSDEVLIHAITWMNDETFC